VPQVTSVPSSCPDQCPALPALSPVQSWSRQPCPEPAAVPQPFWGLLAEIRRTRGKASVGVTSVMQTYGSFNEPVLSTTTEYFISPYLLHACRSHPKPSSDVWVAKAAGGLFCPNLARAVGAVGLGFEPRPHRSALRGLGCGRSWGARRDLQQEIPLWVLDCPRGAACCLLCLTWRSIMRHFRRLGFRNFTLNSGFIWLSG